MNTNQKFSRSVAILTLITGSILLIPLIAMQFTSDVDWSLSDFILMGGLIFCTGFTYLFITRKAEEIAYRVAIAFALLTGFLLIWVNLAVGIIGSEDNLINLWYFGLIAIGLIGGFITRFEAKGMTYTMFAMALAQGLIAVFALMRGMQNDPVSPIVEIVGVNGFFITLFVLSALLFRYAAQEINEAEGSQKAAG
ncbi:MAG: hypothetical protein WD357_07660 [Gracilimonas sp.]